MTYVLVKSDFNWADEADFEALELLGEDECKKMRKVVTKYFKDGGESLSLSVGSNEDVEINDESDFKSGFEFKKVTPEEYKILKKFIGTSWGSGITLSRVCEAIQENLDETLEDDGELDDEDYD